MRIQKTSAFLIASHLDKYRSGGFGDPPEPMGGCKGGICGERSPLLIFQKRSFPFILPTKCAPSL